MNTYSIDRLLPCYTSVKNISFMLYSNAHQSELEPQGERGRITIQEFLVLTSGHPLQLVSVVQVYLSVSKQINKSASEFPPVLWNGLQDSGIYLGPHQRE